jgi:hypothetical protein
MNNQQGPKGVSPMNPEGIRFRAVRMSARLRRLATPSALLLAGEIDTALTDLTRQGEEAGNSPVRRRPEQLGSRTVQVTSSLVRVLKELHLLLSLEQMIRERLKSDPDLSHLEDLPR